MHLVLLVKQVGPEPLDARRSLLILGVLPSPPVSSRDLLAPELMKDALKQLLGALIGCRLLEVPSLGILWGRWGSQRGKPQGGPQGEPEGALGDSQGSARESLMLQPASVSRLGKNEFRLALLVLMRTFLRPILTRPRNPAETGESADKQVCRHFLFLGRKVLQLGGLWLGVVRGAARLVLPLLRFLDKQLKPSGLQIWQAIQGQPHLHNHLDADAPLPHALHTICLQAPSA